MKRLRYRKIGFAAAAAAVIALSGSATPASQPQVIQVAASSHCIESGDVPARAVDRDATTRWCAKPGTNSGWLEIDLGRTTRLDRVVLTEGKGEVIRRFQIMVEQDGAWRNVAFGGFIGARRELRFEPITTQRLRLVICEAADAPSIAEIDFGTAQTASR